ncbi:MAG: phosphatidylserine decarboxylase family protein [Saprospiraceae bacterium]|nr:phosphatidylserine decarboxylase family protein [Saprospiraceae bacterium]HMW38381.1 phosphatidylserine decarboxylase family protein [Saprospiraceae bacterium]HMX89544.1 phosphatidylserine decarboxylase family protein [Saprospiraceae bacterium]HMZ39772.1 phosphatidylserine decarboxylase family protein [Saprospiraceae bacterium]HNA63356.1 phosphatidylserine decarboxylase family protein [Saprospiraceae bacterium]
MIRIHKEGLTWVTGSLIVYLLIVLLLSYMNSFLLWPAAIILGVLLFLVVNFFRNPERIVAKVSDDLVYCPADGKVVVIEKTFESEYFKDERLQVSVFMNPLNVHVNRYPWSGTVSYSRYHPGKFLVAWHPKSSTENERTTVVIKRKDGQEILMRQIAGALAKRICCYSKEGDQAEQGADMGFIKFGSRVDLYLPLNSEIKVSIDQVVKGNVDVIASVK